MALDNLNIVYAMDERNKEIQILKIMYVDNTAPREKLRTKEWLLKINSMVDFKINRRDDKKEETKTETKDTGEEEEEKKQEQD